MLAIFFKFLPTGCNVIKIIVFNLNELKIISFKRCLKYKIDIKITDFGNFVVDALCQFGQV